MILVVQIIMVGGCILEQLAVHWTHWLGARFLDVSTTKRESQDSGVGANGMAGSVCRLSSVLHQRVHLGDGTDSRTRLLDEPRPAFRKDSPLAPNIPGRHTTRRRSR